MRRRLLPVVLAVLVLAGCAAEPAPTPSPEPEGIAEPTVDARPPAEACVADVESAGFWVEGGGAWFEAGTIGESETVAILVPQVQENYCGWMAYAAILTANGIQPLLLNPCGEGLSECDPLGENVTAASEAVLAAATQAKESGATRVVAVGASMGGNIVIRSAELCADDCPIDGAASLAGPIEFAGVETIADAGRITVPLFLAVAPADEVVSPAQLSRIAKAAKNETTLITEGNGHGWALLFDRQLQPTPVATELTGFILG